MSAWDVVVHLDVTPQLHDLFFHEAHCCRAPEDHHRAQTLPPPLELIAGRPLPPRP
jgi:hypothetical protein